jgi:iron complex outermembrane receptor protein
MRRILAVPLMLMVSLAHAQTAPETKTAIPVLKQSVVVTGSYEPVPLEEADRAVRSLPARSQALLLYTISDLLKLDPSLDLQERGANGVQADLSIRGASYGQTLVLLNGRRLNDPQTGHHSLDLPVPLESVERVEVMRGAGSSIYGSDAIGGVVNLIAAPPEASEIRLRGAVGNFGTNSERGSMTGVRGRLSQQLTFSRDFSTGFAPNRDYRNLSFGSATRFRSEKLGFSELDLGYSDKPFGAQGFYGNYPSWERTKTWYAGARQALGQGTEAAFSYRRHTDIYVLYRDRPQIYTNHHINDSWQASLRRRQAFGATNTLHYGAEGFGETLDSTRLGKHDRMRGAVYGSYDMRVLQRWSLSAGVRGETYRGLPGQWSPSLSVGYWASGKLKFRGGVSRAFRVPGFTDMFYVDPSNRGNANLLPEKAWSYEGGAEWRPAGNWRLQATAFQRLDRDGIDFARGPQDLVWQAMNVRSVNFSGLETSASVRAWRGQFDWGYTALRGAGSPLQGFQSKYVFNYPTHQGIFGWTGNLPGGLMARTRVGGMERRGRGAWATWDVYAARNAGRLRPFVQLTNLTNTRYQQIVGVDMPTRAVLGGVEWVVR